MKGKERKQDWAKRTLRLWCRQDKLSAIPTGSYSLLERGMKDPGPGSIIFLSHWWGGQPEKSMPSTTVDLLRHGQEDTPRRA